MKKILLLLAFVLFSCPAHAKMGIYVAPKISVGNQQAKFSLDNYTVDGTYYPSTSINPVDIKANGFNMGFGGAIGYDMYTTSKVPLRFEVDYSIYTKVEGVNSVSITNTLQPASTILLEFDVNTLFVNMYYDFRKSDKKKDNGIAPYVGLGIGTYFGKISCLNTHEFSDIAFNVALGIGYQLNESLVLDFGYRYVYLNDLSLFGTGLGSGSQNRFQAGARIMF